jgi:sec-independent protein translocase protein TatB
MFGISLPELAVIFVLILIVFGPERLPEIAIKLGKLSGELKRNSEAVRREFYNAVYKPAEDFRRKIDSVAKDSLSELNPMSDLPPILDEGLKPLVEDPISSCCSGCTDSPADVSSPATVKLEQRAAALMGAQLVESAPKQATPTAVETSDPTTTTSPEGAKAKL